MNQPNYEQPTTTDNDLTPEMMRSCLPPAELRLMMAVYHGEDLDAYARRSRLPRHLIDRIYADAEKRLRYHKARISSSFSRLPLHEVTSDLSDRPWQSQAACNKEDAEDFFPHGENSSVAVQKIARAKAICRQCPVIQQCLIEAIKNDRQGVWGGLTDNERREYKNRMARIAQAAG